MKLLKKMVFRSLAIPVISIAMITGCEKKVESTNADMDIKVKVYSNDSTSDSILGGYGYNIYISDCLYVHQPHIPAVNGNNGFRTAEDAEKTAGLTLFKIRNNIMPPALSVHELDSLGVIPHQPGRNATGNESQPVSIWWYIIGAILTGFTAWLIYFLKTKKRK